MLALVGLLGVLFAGVVADAAIGMATADDDDDSPPDDIEEADTGEMSPVDWALVDESDEAASGLEGEAEPASAPADDRFGAEPVETEIGRIVVGGPEQETLLGGMGDDQIGGYEDDDLIDAGQGNDTATGGAGSDQLLGGDGNDDLRGDDGDDTLRGDAGADVLAGHSGDDLLLGGKGGDSLTGGEGRDSLVGGTGDDWLAGGLDDDVLHGGEGEDTLDGGDGSDLIFGARDGAGDFLNGGQGDDLLIGGAGDTLTGGEGADGFAVDWGDGDAPVRIDDFDPALDQIVVLYDPGQHPDPAVSFQLTEDGSGTLVMLDGITVAEVPGVTDLSSAAIRLAEEWPVAA